MAISQNTEAAFCGCFHHQVVPQGVPPAASEVPPGVPPAASEVPPGVPPAAADVPLGVPLSLHCKTPSLHHADGIFYC